MLRSTEAIWGVIPCFWGVTALSSGFFHEPGLRAHGLQLLLGAVALVGLARQVGLELEGLGFRV